MARVYAVASSKGGVGKTTTTANLSATLAAAGYDVAVVDGDIGMANLGNQLGVEITGPTLHDVLAGEASVEDATYEGPHGLTVVPGDTALTAFSNADITRLGRVVGSFADRDFVFIDTGAGLSHEAALPLGLADEVVLVSTADRDSLGDTEKTRDLTERLGAEVAGVVLTRVTPGGAPDDATPLDAPILGTIPEDAALRQASDAALPITMYDADSSAAAAYRGVAGSLADGPVRPPMNDETDQSFSPDSSTEELSESEAAAREFQQKVSQGVADGSDESADTDADADPADPSWEDSESWSERRVDEDPEDPDDEPDDNDGGPDQDGPDEDDQDEPDPADEPDARAVPTAEGGVETPVPEAEGEDDGDAVPFADGQRTAPLVEEQPGEGGDADESDEKQKKGFLSRLFG